MFEKIVRSFAIILALLNFACNQDTGLSVVHIGDASEQLSDMLLSQDQLLTSDLRPQSSLRIDSDPASPISQSFLAGSYHVSVFTWFVTAGFGVDARITAFVLEREGLSINDDIDVAGSEVLAQDGSTLCYLQKFDPANQLRCEMEVIPYTISAGWQKRFEACVSISPSAGRGHTVYFRLVEVRLADGGSVYNLPVKSNTFLIQ